MIICRPIITWIHGDKDTNSRDQVDFFTEEIESLLLVSDSILNTFHLHSYYR